MVQTDKWIQPINIQYMQYYFYCVCVCVCAGIVSKPDNCVISASGSANI